MTRYPHEATFNVDGLDCLLITTMPQDLLPAVDIVIEELTALAAVASLDLHDSEVSRLTRMARFADITVPASPVLIDYLSAALWSADLTEGLVDPTAHRSSSGGSTLPGHGWERIEIGETTVSLPRGCVLDLSATASAHAADLLALALADRFGGSGFLVSIDGDIAVAGVCPEGGWQIPVVNGSGRTLQLVSTTHAALGRSDEAARGKVLIDPRTGDPASKIWTQVTVAANTALEANAWASASVLLGEMAPAWLSNRGVTARLERRTGTTRFTQGWPHPVALTAA
ncbi:thiamine biosynthesis lipoprotein [Tessaracoccus bendigoensis DSM 12906]|uniref:FAD:protein FMN transferase n=1 Tax=Tessaracoccus bendigoensis DSM 12906 TaxID=1123357 RepID=A0A1M6BS10_9ACTN|nr:FAD:protein FMN transferase [Tessaracoccus bendigoensis]SHI51477.1 thiamine biosynthesis lipoprotein [Tessaracoccus bendigoensis DSM 12906]